MCDRRPEVLSVLERDPGGERAGGEEVRALEGPGWGG
jgi:hypothetical protein